MSKKQLRRLRLSPGDILLVRNYEDARALEQIRTGHEPPLMIPIAIVESSVHRLSKEYLKKLLER